MVDQDETHELERLVRSSAWLLGVLEAVRSSGLPVAMVGAGVLRDLVWGELHGGFRPGDVKDDPVDLRPERDARADERLRRLLPAVPWEARNQVAAHTFAGSASLSAGRESA